MDAQAEKLTLPRSGFGSLLLRRLLARLQCGSVTVRLPDGSEILHRAGPGPQAMLVLHRWRAISRLLTSGDIGFAEAYLDGDWSSPDVTALIELAARNQGAITGTDRAVLPLRLIHRLLHRLRDNTRAGSRRNIEQHYDLGNEFYARWLDAGMSYSAAIFDDPEASLEDAQVRRQDRIVEMLGIEPGMRVLEIGIGWGGLAERLAAEGCHVTGVTLSPSQLGYAQQRLQAAGLGDKVDLRLQDYRDISGQFDRIVSIEMIEAVGEAWWPTYFRKLRDCLRPGGTIVLQSITIADDRFESYRRGVDFIQRHVFPGGLLPSPSALRSQAAAAGLDVPETQFFGQGYALTLMHWQRRFQAAWPAIEAMGFNVRFRKLWEYYLSYCEAGFRAGVIDVGLWRMQAAESR
ncbi:class I SAM-dependent methyltransferase [Acetobacteraceae bacterium H6797]|nr:class I SAM-dependent methyltransferase [Acetobacteraceae bacterium H6797]